MSEESLNTLLERLDSIDPNNQFAYEEALFIFNSIKNLPVFYTEISSGIRLFRTRANEDDLFNNIADISIPPSKYVNSFARCNRPFQSMFYGSENRQTSFAELAGYWASTKNFGERLKITVGEWEITKPLNGIIITSPDKEKRISQFDKYLGVILDQAIAEEDEDKQEVAIAFYKFMFEKFRKPAKDDPKTYIITTAYSNYALVHTKGETHGIYYPSVPFGEQGINFALTQEAANNFLTLKSALYSEYHISENESGKHSFTEDIQNYTDNVDLEKGLILWK